MASCGKYGSGFHVMDFDQKVKYDESTYYVVDGHLEYKLISQSGSNADLYNKIELNKDYCVELWRGDILRIADKDKCQ